MMSHLKKAVSVPALRDALTGTCVCWFLFDIYLYGVSLYSPEILDMIFGRCALALPTTLHRNHMPIYSPPTTTVVQALRTV